MLLIIYREQPDGSLKRSADVTLPDNQANPEQAAWRLVGRGIDLGAGTYQIMRAGRRGSVAETRAITTADLGVVT